MADKKTLAFLLMDAPYESARTTTAFRLIDAAARRGHDVRRISYRRLYPSLLFPGRTQYEPGGTHDERAGTGDATGVVPPATPLLIVALAAVAVAAAGYLVFRSLRDLVPEQL